MEGSASESNYLPRHHRYRRPGHPRRCAGCAGEASRSSAARRQLGGYSCRSDVASPVAVAPSPSGWRSSVPLAGPVGQPFMHHPTVSLPDIPSWIVQTNGYVPGASGDTRSSSEVPGSTIVRVAPVNPAVNTRLCGRLDPFRNVIAIGRAVWTTVSAGTKAVASPAAVVIVTSTDPGRLAVTPGAVAMHPARSGVSKPQTRSRATWPATGCPRTPCMSSGRRSNGGY
jgi:hypothetical protein